MDELGDHQIAGKRCRKCGQVKPLSQFNIARKNRDGLTWHCKDCVNRRSRAHYAQAHPGERKRRTFSSPLKPTEWEAIIAKGEMLCRTCGVTKPLSEYLRHQTRKKLYYHRDCRPCWSAKDAKIRHAKREHLALARRNRRCRKYGIHPSVYEAMLQQQGFQCAICGRHLDDGRQVIDHDHATGVVRGIVHGHCNLMIGNAREDISILIGGIRYLRKHQSKPSRQDHVHYHKTG